MWKCPNCGRQKGDMKLLGKGLMKCPGCGAILIFDLHYNLQVLKEVK